MFNDLDKTHWVTKHGEILNPSTDMSAEHIVNVMNMLSDRAVRNESRMMMLREVLKVQDFNSVKNKLPKTDVVSVAELRATPLFKSLVDGLKSAVRSGRIENENKIKSYVPYEVMYPAFNEF